MSHEPNLNASRCTDLCGEPVTCLLAPITGYQDVSLVTLEESIKPVAHLFDGIETNVYITKMGMANPMDGLGDDESRSIHLYTMPSDSGLSIFQALNEALRDENRQILKPWFSFLKLFLTALHKLPSQAMTVWRGVRDVDLRSRYPIGSKLVCVLF
jgi:hypothetical protein